MRLTWPLVGRSEELRLVEAAIADPNSSGVVIRGAAGVGKSRVAREALNRAAAKGFETRWAVGTASARALPLGAFTSWAGSSIGDQLGVVRDVIEALTSSAKGAAVVLAVDDVPFLDDLSTFVVHQIVERGAAKVVLTIRDGEPVSAAVQDIWRAGRFEQIDLQPLSQDETTSLLAETLNGPLDPDAASRLWKLSYGNVLYLQNIVEQEVEDERLACQHGSWLWSGDPVIAPHLAELIESRIGALPTAVSEVIDTLAVGEPLELTALADITDPAAIEDADARSLIRLDRVHGQVEVRLAHPLYGEVRRRRSPHMRLRRLRGLVATQLAAADGGDDIRIVVRRAALSVDSDLEPDPELLVNAAKGAMWLADPALAERLADAAIGAGGPVDAHLIRAHALSWLGRYEEADGVFAGIDTTELGDLNGAAIAFARATNKFVGLADPIGARAVIDDAARTTPPEARGCIDAFLLVYWALLGKPEPAIESGKGVALDRLPDIVGAAPTVALVCALADVGRPSDAVDAAEAGYAIVERSKDSAGLGFVIAEFHVHALLMAGRIHDACDIAERVSEQAANLSGGAQLQSRAVLARAAIGAGRLDVASSLLEPVMEMVATVGVNGIDFRVHLHRTMSVAIRGLSEEAMAALAALEAGRHAGWRCLDFEIEVARGWAAAAGGAVSDAVAVCLSAAAVARENGQFAPEVVCLQTATQFGDSTTAARLSELEGIVEGPRVGVAARFAAALRDGDGAQLSAISEDFEQMGDLVAAMDAAALGAKAYRRENLRGSAYGCQARAQALADRCGNASTPALLNVSGGLPLTSRELEIVMLLGEGLTTRAVADRLTLSVRTIEGHIYRAMGKTGVTTREELAALLPRRSSST